MTRADYQGVGHFDVLTEGRNPVHQELGQTQPTSVRRDIQILQIARLSDIPGGRLEVKMSET